MADKAEVKPLLSGFRRFVRRPTVLALLVIIVGLTLTMLGVMQTQAAQRRDSVDATNRRTAAVAAAIRQELVRYRDTLRETAVAIGSHEEIDAVTFNSITSPLTRSRLGGAASLLYVVPAATEQVPAVQAYWRRKGSDGLVLRPAGRGHDHTFLVLGRTLDGRPLNYGIDVSQVPEPAEAMHSARRTDDVSVSDAYRLLKDRSLPRSQQQLSVIMAAPVHAPDDAYGRQGEFRGWVLMSLRSGNLLRSVLSELSQGLINVSLSAALADGRPVTVAEFRSGSAGPDQPVREVDVPAGDRLWRLRVQATELDGRLRAPDLPLVTTRGIGGIVLSVLAAGLALILSTSRQRGLKRIDEATAAARHAEAEARRHSDLLQAVMDSISDGVSVVDQEGRYLLRNPAGQRILGRDGADEVAGPMDPRIRRQFFEPDGTTLFPAAELPLLRALAGESVDEVEILVRVAGNPEPSVITASSRPLISASGQIGAVVVFRDVTVQKKTTAELGEANERLSTELDRRVATEIELLAVMQGLADQQAYLTEILDGLKIAVMTCDTDGTIVHRNLTGRQWSPNGDGPLSLDTFVTMTGFTDLDGGTLPLERLPLHRSLQGEIVEDEELLTNPDRGEPRRLLVNSRPLHDAAGKRVGAVSSAFDVTMLREREAELRDFAGAVAHDLKGPLAAIVGHLEIITDLVAVNGEPPERLTRSLGRADGAAQRMTQLINGLLDYVIARDAPLKLARLDLGALVGSVIEERTAHLRLTGDAAAPDIFCGPMPTLVADPHMLRQVLDNLIGNAIKYTREGERARIDISARYLPDGLVQVDIADRGIGIPADQQDKVFRTFHRAHRNAGYHGTGLGLPICKRIIERHDGVIGVSDNPGGGSRFFFTLPASGEPALRPADEKIGGSRGAAGSTGWNAGQSTPAGSPGLRG